MKGLHHTFRVNKKKYKLICANSVMQNFIVQYVSLCVCNLNSIKIEKFMFFNQNLKSQKIQNYSLHTAHFNIDYSWKLNRILIEITENIVQRDLDLFWWSQREEEHNMCSNIHTHSHTQIKIVLKAIGRWHIKE